jgi:methionyl aminopeptidase
MFCIGEVCEKKRSLIGVLRECIELGLRQVKPWGFLGDMGQAIHEHAVKSGCSVVKEIGGHGIGLAFHEDPWVSYVSKKKTEMLMVPGMIFTIEPMINAGKDEIFLDKKNGWTYYTVDGESSVQEEIMVMVTTDGYEVLAY